MAKKTKKKKRKFDVFKDTDVGVMVRAQVKSKGARGAAVEATRQGLASAPKWQKAAMKAAKAAKKARLKVHSK